MYRPDILVAILTTYDNIDEIYDAMTKDDLSEVVIKVIDVLKKTNTLPPGKNEDKSEEVSTLHRNKGNDVFKTGRYCKAMSFYNQALMTAPKGSRALKLAYSNRSALFYTLKLWKPCLFDVNKCFKLGCPPDIVEKLKKRKQAVKQALIFEKFTLNIMLKIARKCTLYGTKSKNSLVSCASSDVEFATSPTKVVASKDIKIGTIVACETAYVSHTESINASYSCHFCQRNSLNLIPCDDCGYALFCDEKCKDKCYAEFHVYECKIMKLMETVCTNPMANLAVKAALKLRAQCKSWEELIAASLKTGIEKIEESSVEEIYDGRNIYSILSFRDDRPFIHGRILNASFVCAAILYYLDDGTFFPNDESEKLQAVRAFARILMYLSIFPVPICFTQAQIEVTNEKSVYGGINFGLFSFIGKLKNSCNPNLLISNMNNKLLLMVMKTIKSGDELTVSYVCNPHENYMERHAKNVRTFVYTSHVCDCPKCMGSTGNDSELSNYQRKYFCQIDFNAMDADLGTVKMIAAYQSILRALEVSNDEPNSKEYLEIFERLRRCLLFCDVIY